MSGVVVLSGWLRVLATGTRLRGSVGKVQVNRLVFLATVAQAVVGLSQQRFAGCGAWTHGISLDP